MTRILSRKFGCQNRIAAFILLLSGMAIAGPDQDLIKAARVGDVIKLEQAIEQGASLEATDASDNTALHITAAANHVAALKVLLDQSDVDVDATNKQQNTSLHLASSQGHLKPVQMLIAANADVHVRNKLKQTATHLVAQGLHMLVLYELQQAGADLHAVDAHGKTPDDYARDAAEGSKPSPSRALVKVDDNKQPVWSKQRIKSINKGDVLARMMRPEECDRELYSFETFPVVFHRNNRTVFTLPSTDDELLENMFPKSDVIKVGPHTFYWLVQKTGPGPAGRPKNLSGVHKHVFDSKAGVTDWKKQIDGYFKIKDRFGCQWIRLCSRTYTEKPCRQIPKQTDGYSCGINSAARGMLMCKGSLDDYSNFKKYCPLSLCIFKKVGPYPRLLAQYINEGYKPKYKQLAGDGPFDAYRREKFAKELGKKNYLPPGVSAQAAYYNSFSDCVKDIKTNMQKGLPVIPLFIASGTSMHYVNIVGVCTFATEKMRAEGHEGKVALFVIMDTNDAIYYYSRPDIELKMRNVGHLGFGCKRYNMIRFAGKVPPFQPPIKL